MKRSAKSYLTPPPVLADNTLMGFRIAQMANLARQMAFTPNDQRLRQIAAAEELLLQIDPAKAYPFDFVVFRITGYHPKQNTTQLIRDDGFAGELLTGLGVQHDLGLLIEQVSETLNLIAEQMDEPVLTIDDVVLKFNASEKSIQRWRRRGLAARRFIFPGGNKRVAFLSSSVQKFFAIHREGLARTANFSPLTETEKSQIVRHVRRLAEGGLWNEEIFRRVGCRLNRSPLTVAEVAGSDPFLHSASAKPEKLERECIAEAFDSGASLSSIAALIGRPRVAIYRILLERRLEGLERAKPGFIDDPLYHQPEAAGVIDEIAKSDDVTRPAPGAQEDRVPRDVPAYLADLYRYPLLSASRERALFLKMHFHRFQFASISRKLEAQKARWRDLEKLQSQLDQSTEVKNQIVAANLRLVVSVARKHLRAGVSLMELVSDGNLALMRTADNYDFHRGNRFSTYATLALMKEFARAAARSRRTASIDTDVADERGYERGERSDRHQQVRELLSRLPHQEQSVLRAHFGITDERGREPASLKEIAEELGLTRQRVKKIEHDALLKLRQALKIKV
jgi:RNA polymerase primary sigma factor/RNA polymerase sigma factor